MCGVIGVDEAGRGALAGPVVAASVCLDPALDISLFSDSKQLTSGRRDELFQQLNVSNSIIGIGVLSHRYIDRVNILNATMEAMKRCVVVINHPFSEVLIDGNRCPEIPGYKSVRSIVKGDTLVPSISAASIVAKVTRDRIMCALHHRFPIYGFAAHKGYGTDAHYDALFSVGPSDVHRRSFNLTRQQTLF